MRSDRCPPAMREAAPGVRSLQNARTPGARGRAGEGAPLHCIPTPPHGRPQHDRRESALSPSAIGSACRRSARLRRGVAHAMTCAVALGLAACAAPKRPPSPKYVAPTSGPTAKLVMRGTVPQGDLYGVFVYDDSEKCAGSRLVGVGNTARPPVTTALAAGTMTTVEFYLLKPNKQFCNVRWSFTPVAGKTYLLSGRALNTAGYACLAQVMDMSDPESLKPEPTALRRNPSGSACLPLAQSKAATSANATEAGQSTPDAVLRQGAGADDLNGLIGQ